MSRLLFVVLMAAGLIAAPLPAFMQTAAAQTAPPAAPDKETSQDEEAADAGATRCT
jgi:hypothetical protein